MTAVPATRTWVTGEIVTASYMNTTIRDVDNWLLASAICQARQTVAQTLTTATPTALTCDAEDVDSTGMHSTSSNTSRLTAVYPGWYQVCCAPAYAANTTGRRMGGNRVNGTALNGGRTAFPATAASAAKVVSPVQLAYLNAADYYEGEGTQESGGNLNTAVGSTDQNLSVAQWRSN